jgi:hypothetical protein
MKLELMSQINGGKKYYYPKNEAAKTLCELMQRKCFVERDFPFFMLLNITTVVLNETTQPKGA